jgi:hypothetical protein
MTRLLFLLTILLLPRLPTQDVKVATWSTGSPDTDNYESLAFWIKDEKRAYIRYNHGTSADDIELNWLGPDSLRGRRGFKAGFPPPDNRLFFIVPASDSVLLVIAGNHPRKFHWENENGAGTEAGAEAGDSTSSCNICAHSASQATAWLHQYFWK